MQTQRLAYLVAACLVAVGLLAITVRTVHRQHLRQLRADTFWRLDYRVRFVAHKAGDRVHIVLPHETPRCEIFRESVRQQKLAVDYTRATEHTPRLLSGQADHSDDYRFTIRVYLHTDPEDAWAADLATPGELPAYLAETPAIPVNHPAVHELTETLGPQGATAEKIADRVFEYFKTTVDVDGSGDTRDALATLKANSGGTLSAARAMTALLRHLRVPARVVTGLRLQEDRTARPIHWVEAVLGGHWTPFDPEGAFARTLPVDYVPMNPANEWFWTSDGGANVEAALSVRQEPLPGILLGGGEKHWTRVFDLDRLPMAIQDIIAVLLIMPIGALATAVFRNIVGLPTFGTFTPSLIAISFNFADWRTGVLILLVVWSSGVVFRRGLDRLKLLLIPRLGILLTLVVTILIFSISVVDYLGWTPGPEAVFLPMVILSGMIERLFITLEEDGFQQCLKLLLNTALVAFTCFLMFRSETLTWLVVTYPEVHLVTAALLILVGRYVGYRLTELWRFKPLARAIAAHRKPPASA